MVLLQSGCICRTVPGHTTARATTGSETLQMRKKSFHPFLWGEGGEW